MKINTRTVGLMLVWVAITLPHTLSAETVATTRETTVLKPLENNWRPVDGKSTVVFKTTPQGDLKINLFFPKDWKLDEHRSAIVFFFGGGFVAGGPGQFTTTAAYFYGRGMVAATMEYRVRSTHHTDPDKGVEDAKSSIRWLRINAPRLGINPSRIVALGASSGGTCAADAGYGPAFDSPCEDKSVSSKPDALVLWYPHLGWPNDTSNNKPEDVKTIKTMTPVFENWRGIEKGPPAIMFLGTKDNLLFEKVRIFAKQVAAAGSRAEFYSAAGQGHGFCGDRPGGNPWHDLVVQQTDIFLASLGFLKGPPTVSPPADAHVALTKETP